MDPISIITLAASTTKAAYTLSTQLYLFVNAVKNVDGSLKSLSGELSGLRRSLDATSVALQNPLVRSDKAAAPENTPIWAAVAGALDDCRETLQTFEKRVQPYQQQESKRSIFKKSVTVWKLNLSKDEINLVRDQIQTHTGSLQVALQTLNILVAGLGPTQAAGDISQSITSLTETLNSIQQGQHEGVAHYSEVEKAARAVLLNAPDLAKTGLLTASTEEAQTAATAAYKDIINRFDASIYLTRQNSGFTAPPLYKAQTFQTTDGEMLNITPEGSDSSDSEDELEVTLARDLFAKGKMCLQSRKYMEAEGYIRDAFGHLPDMSKMDDNFDADEARIELALSCFYQGKVQEAELILQLLVQSQDKVDEKVLKAHHILAMAYACLFDFDSALKHCTAAARGRRQLFGKQDPRHHSSLQLLSLVYHVNGDFVSSAAYARKIPSSESRSTENEYILDLLSGYLPNEQLRMSLRDKQDALNELAQEGLIDRQREIRPDEEHSGSAPPLVTTHPSLRAVDLAKTLYWAVGNNKPLTTKFLLSRGVSPQNTLTVSPLCGAAEKNHHEVVRILLEAGGDINGRNDNGETPLYWATVWGQQHSVVILLDHGADPNIADTDGSTPLMNAAYRGPVSIIELLLASGAALETKNKRGRSALGTAFFTGRVEVARCLIEHGAAVDGTALHEAVKQQSETLVRLILARNVDVNARDLDGRTPLFSASSSGMIKLLVEHGADVNVVDNKGVSVVTERSKWSAEQVQTLVDLGADLNMGDKDRCAGVIATLRQSHDILQVVRQYPGAIVRVKKREGQKPEYITVADENKERG